MHRWLPILLLACDQAPAVPAGDECAFALDGACDEPTSCALGTDSTDCAAACAAPAISPLHGAACAHRDPPREPALDPPPVPSTGTVHATGFRHGVVEVPSGADESVVVARHYLLYVPSTYDPARAAPLLVVMPGHRVDHFSLPDYTELVREAEMNRFVVVFTEQEFRWADLRWAWWTDWDWRSPRENPDLVFLRRLVGRITSEYTIDRSRVFASGHSRGGAMAFIAALEMPDVFAAAVPQSGFSEFNWHERIATYTGRRTPLYVIHGVADPDVCIDCRPGGTCGVAPRPCGSAMASDALVEMLRDQGWGDDVLVYRRLESVAHRWQPQLNQAMWDFLVAHPLPADMIGGGP